jgi:hypothetical protein
MLGCRLRNLGGKRFDLLERIWRFGQRACSSVYSDLIGYMVFAISRESILMIDEISSQPGGCFWFKTSRHACCTSNKRPPKLCAHAQNAVHAYQRRANEFFTIFERGTIGPCPLSSS